MAEKRNFTRKLLDSVPIPPKGKRTYIYDKKTDGLGLSVTDKNAKSFFVYRKINGKPRRVTLGRYPDMTIDQARIEAMDVMSKIAGGENPIEQKRAEKAAKVTLNEVFKSYIDSRPLKPGTIADYEKVLKESFNDWKHKALSSITRDKVKKLHRDRGKQSQARANNAMRVLRALFNYAKAEYKRDDGTDLFVSNPVDVLSETKAWFKIKRKQSHIQKEQLADWFNAVQALNEDHVQSNGHTVRDYVLFILLTGTRREEAAQLTWKNVNLKTKAFTLIDTKNSEIVTLPLSDYVYNILKERNDHKTNEYVFEGKGKRGYIIETNRQLNHVRAAISFHFSLHDLRRTFITVAESMDISPYTIKRLVNHKTSDNADVTAGYIVVDIDRLREASQKITDHILRLAKVRQGKVVKLKRA